MKKQLLFAALAAVLVAGCTKDNSAQGEDPTPGREVSVTLPVEMAAQTDTPIAPMSKSATPAEATTPSEGFSVSFGEPEHGAIAAATAQTASVRGTDAADAPQTAAAPVTRAPETALTNVWVLQFNASGTNVKTINMGSLAAGGYLTSTLLTGTGYTICIVANGPASGFSTSNPATLADFEAKMLHTAAVTDAATLPISGKLTGVTVVDLGNGKGAIRQLGDASAAIVLRRIHAEVTLAVDFVVTGYTLTGAQLYNVPAGATYGWNNATTTFPANNVTANFTYTLTAAAGMTPLTTTTDGTKKIYKWFTGDNRRGEVSGLIAQNDRHSAKAPAYATFARVILTNSTISSQKIYYDIYLGSGAVTNFDVKRNMTYTLTAAIKGTDSFQEALIGTDARVSGVDMPIYLTDSKATSPIAISPKSMELTAAIWGPATSIPGAQDIFNGKTNTDAIMGVSATAYPAAKHCRDLSDSYYLPAQAELMLMWIYLPAIPTTDLPGSGSFWSGTVHSSSVAWYVTFSDGSTGGYGKSTNLSVRCVREN